jgi:hypothetical protein
MVNQPGYTMKRKKNALRSLDLVEKNGCNPTILWPFACNPEGLSDKDRRRIERALNLPYLHCGTAPPPPVLEERLSNVQLLKILRSNPSKNGDVRELEKIIRDAEYILKNCRSKKEDALDEAKAFVSETKQARLKLLIEDANKRISFLESLRASEVQAAEREQRRAEVASAQFASISEDLQLAGALWHALDSKARTVGYIYLKCWRMPDSSCWFKVGITNNPDRRETEQNVLPVAAETIICVDVGSMDRARAIEAVIHQVLKEQRITDANNREIFHLSDQQALAVKAVLERLE